MSARPSTGSITCPDHRNSNAVASGPATRAMTAVTDVPVLFAQSGDPVALGLLDAQLSKLVVSAPAEMIDVLRAQAARAAELDELATWLKSRNARFSVATETQPAEQLPLAMLPSFAQMNSARRTSRSCVRLLRLSLVTCHR